MSQATSTSVFYQLSQDTQGNLNYKGREVNVLRAYPSFLSTEEHFPTLERVQTMLEDPSQRRAHRVPTDANAYMVNLHHTIKTSERRERYFGATVQDSAPRWIKCPHSVGLHNIPIVYFLIEEPSS